MKEKKEMFPKNRWGVKVFERIQLSILVKIMLAKGPTN